MTFKIADLLDAAKGRAALASDYQLARKLDVDHSTVSKWRHGKRLPDEGACVALATLAGMDVDRVLAECARLKVAAKKKDETRFARRLTRIVLTLPAVRQQRLDFDVVPARETAPSVAPRRRRA